MADAIPPMIIDIQLQTDQLKAQMANLESRFTNLGNTVNKAQTPFKNFGTTLKTLLPAVGIAGLVMFTKQVISAGEESNKSDARLKQIATSMNVFGGNVIKVTERLKNYADAMARQTGVDDEVIKKTQAKLLTFKELALSADTVGGAFDRATNAALDMASAGFGEATSNAVQLGKALNDPIKGVTALTRSGITFTESEKAKIATLVKSGQMLEAQKFVLKAIETQVGGTAKATASATDRMKQAYGQVQEAIGLALLPMLDKFANWFTGVAPKIEAFFRSLNDPTTEAGKKWAEFTKQVQNAFKWLVQNAETIKNYAIAIGTVVVAYKSVATALTVYKTAVELATVATKLFAAAEALLPWGMIAIAIGLVAGAYMTLAGKTDIATAAQDRYNRAAAGKPKGTLVAVPGLSAAFHQAYDRKGDPAAARYAAMEASASAKAAADAAKDGGGGGGGSDKLSKARAAADAKFVKALRTTQKAITDANNKYNSDVQAANDKYGALITQYADEMTGIIQTSMNRLKDAFKNAVQVNVGDIFKGLVDQGKATTDDLLASLKTRLQAAKTLADNAAALSGAGFSQTFIEQVVAQGPDLGNQLAETLKNATPESQKEIQGLFRESEVLANSGMDSLAQTLYDKAGLATDELKKLYDNANANMLKAQKDLSDALKAAATALNDSMIQIGKDFDDVLKKMADSAAAHAKTIADTMAKISTGKATAVAAGATAASPAVPYANTIATPFSASQAAWNAISVTNNVSTDASPALIADTTVAAIKYGIPYGVSLGQLLK